jgi:hypothetical protein
MGIKVELLNVGPELGNEITVRVEHALSEKSGDWRVSITGSRESENWEMRIHGPKEFERSYTLSGVAGQHTPDAICRLILQLVSAASS